MTSWSATLATLRFPRPRGLARPSERVDSVHEPVMVEELLELFALKPGDVVVDGTVGLGGHAVRFAEAIAPGGALVGLDWDASMLAHARRRLEVATGIEVRLEVADFRELGAVLAAARRAPNAILLDLGLNSAQVDDASRGFSFYADGPLDMRQDRTRGEPASALLNRLGPAELETILFEFGDERWARAIARAIVERRRSAPLRTTFDLVACVEAAVPPRAREKRIHPATRTFQAVRIAVNKEFEGLREAMLDAASALAPGGVLAVLSYHSGEDRIVKNAFRDLAAEGFEAVGRKPLTPGAAEVSRNRRSRSAKLRAVRRPA